MKPGDLFLDKNDGEVVLLLEPGVNDGYWLVKIIRTLRDASTDRLPMGRNLRCMFTRQWEQIA